MKAIGSKKNSQSLLGFIKSSKVAAYSSWDNFLTFGNALYYFSGLVCTEADKAYPVPNYKSISVLGNSKSKCYFVFQYWASLKKSLTSVTSLGQDLGNTCKLIPKSNPTFQKNSGGIFEFKKISQRATILALLFGHFPGVLENDAGAYQIDYWVIISTPGGSIEGFSGVLGRFEPFFSRFSP